MGESAAGERPLGRRHGPPRTPPPPAPDGRRRHQASGHKHAQVPPATSLMACSSLQQQRRLSSTAPQRLPRRRQRHASPPTSTASPQSQLPQPASRRTLGGGGRSYLRRPGGLRQTVQAAADQARLHASGRRSSPGHPLRQRVLTDNDMQIRGVTVVLQEHVQAETPVTEVAGGGGLDDGLPDKHRQDRGPGEEEEKANEYRSVSEGSVGAALPQAT